MQIRKIDYQMYELKFVTKLTLAHARPKQYKLSLEIIIITVIGVIHAPKLGAAGFRIPDIFGTYMRTHSMRNSNHILHHCMVIKTRCEETILRS